MAHEQTRQTEVAIAIPGVAFSTAGAVTIKTQTENPIAKNASKGFAPVLLATLLCLLLLVKAQTIHADTNGFRGRVTDVLSEQPIRGAIVKVGEVQATTDEDGYYLLRLSPGTYEISVQATSYIAMSKSYQVVRSNVFTNVDFAMVLSAPTAAQRIALDALLRQPIETKLTAEELATMRISGFLPSGVTSLPSTVRVLMPDGTVVVMPLDEYVKGVLPREMPPYWPMEALKAQAVAARCYAASGPRHADVGADVCTTTHCQVWSPVHYETTDRAVESTHNVAITYGGNIIRAFFFARCAGSTRNAIDVWGVNVPYCRSVDCPCGSSPALGHGVGMCQEGVRVMAQNGHSYTDILLHYYSNVQVAALPSHILRDGRVWPEQGDTMTMFHYEIQYISTAQPIAAYVYIDGQAYAMSPVTRTVSGGTTYRYSTFLPAGEHQYAFHFEDGYNPPVDFPASGTFNGPVVRMTAGPTPIARSQPTGTEAVQWIQATQSDFAPGTLQDTVLTREGDGEVSLAPGRTLGIYTSTVKLAPIEFVAIGTFWHATTPAGTAITVALRSSRDGSSWSDWTIVPPMDAEREESPLFYGELLYLRGPYVQYRLTLTSTQAGVGPVLSSLTLILIDSRRGNTAEQAQALAAATAPPTGPIIIPRSAWGADERLMTWPPEYRTVRKFVIHHTATSNADLDPAATVRAIYYYHAVTRGWGDIGYNYLIDTQGRIYEGRYGGEGVVGGHAKQYAWGSIGISLIGNYDEVAAPAAMERSLIELIAWKGNLHLVHPTDHGFFIDRDLPNIFAHRDVAETTCPGRYAYARMAAIRTGVLARMNELPPNMRIDAPLAESRIGGVVTCLTTVSPAVTQVTFYVDGSASASDNSAPFSWKWNTSTVTDGLHHLRAEARTALNLRSEKTVTVTVDNTPPTGTLSAPAFHNAPTVTLLTWADGAAWMLLSNGWQWEGEDLEHQSGSKISDAAAGNGWAWEGHAGRDQAGWWYGPYFRELPIGRSYRVYFRLRANGYSPQMHVATLDVSDDFGVHTYVSQALLGEDLLGNRYQEFYLDFSYYRRDNYGLEFRVFYPGQCDLYLDRISVFRAPLPDAQNVEWILPTGDGPKVVQVRYLDAAGNPSEIISTTVILDTQAPQWLEWDGIYAQVRDELSGLHASSAQFATSSDGVNWGAWQAARLTATEGTTATVSISAPTEGATAVRFRISDRAGNTAVSPAYTLPTPVPTKTSTPTLTPSATPSPTVTSTSTPTATVTPIPTVTGTPTDTPIPSIEPSPTASPIPPLPSEPGAVRGRALLQGRIAHGGVTVIISEGATTTSAADGSYLLAAVPAGTYTVTLRMPGYLDTYRRNIAVQSGAVVELPDTLLYGGDANGDCTVNLPDLVIVSVNFRSSPPKDPRADINNDGIVDLFDLLLVSINLGKSCTESR